MRMSVKPASRISASKTARSSSPDGRALGGVVRLKRGKNDAHQGRMSGRRPARHKRLPTRGENAAKLGKSLAAIGEEHQAEHRDAEVEAVFLKWQCLAVGLDDLDIGRLGGSIIAAKLAEHGRGEIDRR